MLDCMSLVSRCASNVEVSIISHLFIPCVMRNLGFSGSYRFSFDRPLDLNAVNE
jgi:hypothetical protein